MKAFGTKDHAKSLKDLDLSKEIAPMQHSLGLCWEIATDTFTFTVSDTVRAHYSAAGIMCSSVSRGDGRAHS